jgi:competence protein ComEC
MRRLFPFLFLGGLMLNACILFFLIHDEGKLSVSFLDVGQGDAIFIQGPTGTQVLIDGGKDRSVLRELGKRMSPFDRSLEVVIATHPDADHIGGLPGVFDRYKVGAYLSSGVEASTNQAEAIEAVAEKEKGTSYELRRGDRILLGGGAYLDILFPDREVSLVETNTGSVVARLVYGDTSFLLTGDSPEAVEEYLVTLDGTSLESDVLKAGHHGSKTSTSEVFLRTVAPGAVVISAGKDNSYGHPHEEVVSRIETLGAHIFSTLGNGAVVFESDGRKVVRK